MNGKLDKYSMRTQRRGPSSEISEENDESASVNLKTNLKLGKKISRQRQENSLGELTRNFIEFIHSQGDKIININDVVRKLNVKKRRIYDITNVLEGIGYLVKKGKNKIEWVREDLEAGDNFDSDEEERLAKTEELEDLKRELKELNEEDKKLDKMINNIKSTFENLNEDKNFNEFGYVTFDDIKSLTQKENLNLIAIKAPSGTSVEIPDPEHIEKIYLQTYENMKNGKEEFNSDLLDSLSKKHQIFLDSPNGEIMCYLVLGKNEEDVNGIYKNEEIRMNTNTKQNMKNLNNCFGHSYGHNRNNLNHSLFNNNLTSDGSNSNHQFKANFGNNNNQILQSNSSIRNIQNYYSDSGMII